MFPVNWTKYHCLRAPLKTGDFVHGQQDDQCQKENAADDQQQASPCNSIPDQDAHDSSKKQYHPSCQQYPYRHGYLFAVRCVQCSVDNDFQQDLDQCIQHFIPPFTAFL